MSEESVEYLAVLKVSYDYEPQSDEEIAIKEDQLLFLLEKTDDDWWKVKIKGESQEDEHPVGLVPAAYVEPAPHSSVVKALYDYEASAPGELSMKEDDVLLVFDREEAWLLVQNQAEGGKAGYVPENYVQEIAEEDGDAPVSLGRIVVPPAPPQPASTYVDPADRVASTKATADDIKTWSVSEIDKKGKKKKGTLGIGNGAIFFASDSDKTPVQKWQAIDIENTTIEKSKHVHIEVGGSAPISLHFNAGSKDAAEAIITKLASSKALSAPRTSVSSQLDEPQHTASPSSAMRVDAHKKGGASVRFAPTSPTVIPPRSPSEEEYADPESEAKVEVEYEPEAGHEAVHEGEQEETADALYDFEADGEDELSVKEGDRLVVLERNGDEWWKCRNSEGAEGVVPASYLEMKYTRPDVPSASVADEPAAHIDQEAEERRETEARAEAERLAEEQAEKRRIEKERKKQEEASRARAAAAAAEVDRKRREKEKEREKAAAAEAEAQRKRKQQAKQEQAEADKAGRRASKSNGEASSSRTSVDGKRVPPAETTRIWHDRSGQFRVEAAFLGYSGGKLRLHKINGVVIEVPSEKMSKEDMQYVEQVTNKKSTASAPAQRTSEDDVPLEQRKRILQSEAPRPPSKKGPKIDWFEFFLSAGCDIDDCTRYASSFERDKIDEVILPDITDATMRSLGLREGDIIRVTKAITQRHPKKPDSTQEQLLRDEVLARQLQEEERTGKKPTSPAPNLFATGPDGALKQPRRGRPQPSRSNPATTVGLDALNTVSDNIQRTGSPQAMSPAAAPIQAPPRSSSTLVPTASAPAVSSGFDDDAWTPRPSSAKPSAPTPQATAPRAPSAPPPASSTSTAVNQQPSRSLGTSPTHVQNSGNNLAKATESDIFDQLSRLSQLRTTSPAMGSAVLASLSNTATTPMTSSPPASYHSGLGMGSSPIPLGQHVQNQQARLSPPQQNGPRGPFAPVPANQSLLQPLIPTTTGFNRFVPTRPGNTSFVAQPQQPLIPSQITGFPNNPQPLIPQTTCFPSMGPMLSQPTGMPGGNFGGFGSTSSFSPNGHFSTMQTNPTGFNPGFGQSPFITSMSPPPLPLAPPASNTSPANVFAQMKSGTFATSNENGPQPQEKYDALRPNPLTAQPTGWGNPANGFQGAYPGYR